MLATGKGLPRDVYLHFSGNNPETYGYIVRNLEKSSAVEYAPRFSSGKSDETDLSLLKAETFSFKGGMFQRRQDDNSKNSIVYGYYNGYDDTLYPYPNGTYFGTDYYGVPSAECYGNNTTFIASRIGSTNIIRRINDSGTQTTLSLPSGLSSATIAITDMVVFGKYLVVVTQSASVSVNTYRFDMVASSWQDVGGSVNRIAVLRGRLYGVQANGNIWTVPDATATTWSWTLLYSSNATSIPSAWFEFNGALWLSIQGVTYRFDGVNLVEVLNHECLFAEVYNGAVYYMVKKWLYRFNGSVVEKIQFFDETVYGVRADDENLYIVTQSPLSKYSGYDSPKDPTDTLMGRLYYFNGTAFYEAYESFTSNPESGFASWPYGLARQKSGIVLIGCNSASGYGYARRHSPTENQTSYVMGTTSEVDNGYPNNWKNLQYIDINADGWAGTASCEIQVHDGTAWTDWINLGNFSSTVSRIAVPNSEDYLYKMLRVRVQSSQSAGSLLSIRSFTLRYTLQPRQRSNVRIDFVLPTDDAQGVKDRYNNRIEDAKGNNSTYMFYSTALDRALYAKIPLFIIGSDYTQAVSPAITTGVGTLTLAGSVPFNPVPNTIDEQCYVGITNDNGVTWEIASVSVVGNNLSSTNATTPITLKARSISGSTISINSNTIFAPAIQVYCQRLVSERIIADGSPNHQVYATGSNPEFSNFERIKSLEFVEV